MKRIMYCMTVLLLLFFFGFSAFTFVCSTNANYCYGKSEITIGNDNDFTYPEYIQRIENACRAANVDIMFSYMKYDNNTGDDDEYISFATNNTKDFFPFVSAISENTAYSTDIGKIEGNYRKEKVTFVDLFYDYTVYPLSAMTEQQMRCSDCIVNKSELVKLADALSEQELSMSVDDSFQFDGILISLLRTGIAVMLILTFFSILFWQLSRSRADAIKRLEGYTFRQAISDSIAGFARFYLCAVLVCLIATAAFFTLTSGFGLFIFYLKEYYKYIIFVIAGVILLFALSCTHILFIEPLPALKGNDKRKVFHILAVIAKFAVVIVLMAVCNKNLSTLRYHYNQLKAYQMISDKLENYHALTNTKMIEKEEEEEGYRNFYQMTHYANDAILMHAMPCCMPRDEGNIAQWYVWINDNYMDFNPIYAPDGTQIKYEDIKNDKAVILIPEWASKEEVLKWHASRFEDVNPFEISVYTYDSDQRFYIYEIISTKYPGYIMNPVVLISRPQDKVSGYIANGELIFKAHTNDFSKEITPLLRKCDIDWMTGSTPNVGAMYSSFLKNSLFEVIVYTIVILVFTFLLICSVVYETWLYYKNNQRSFTILKMNGYSFFMIHYKKLIFTIAAYGIIMLTGLHYGIPPVFPLATALADIILFYAILESRTAKYSSTVLKGA